MSFSDLDKKANGSGGEERWKKRLEEQKAKAKAREESDRKARIDSAQKPADEKKPHSGTATSTTSHLVTPIYRNPEFKHEPVVVNVDVNLPPNRPPFLEGFAVGVKDAALWASVGAFLWQLFGHLVK